jgi:hypothetical protein
MTDPILSPDRKPGDADRALTRLGVDDLGLDAGVELIHVAAQNWAASGFCGTGMKGGGRSAALSMQLAVGWPPWPGRAKAFRFGSGVVAALARATS